MLFAQAITLVIVSSAVWYCLKCLTNRSSLSDIAGPPRGSWWSGNFFQLFNPDAWDFHTGLSKEYGASVRVSGLLGSKLLYTFDPLALTYIFVKNQHIFEETDAFTTSCRIIFGNGLLSTTGEHHWRQRKLSHPVFSLKHIRGLIPVFYPIAHELRDVISREVGKGGKDINVMEWISRASLEFIGQGGFGYSFDALDKTKVNKYIEATLDTHLFAVRQMTPYIEKLGPGWLRRKVFLDMSPSKLLRQARDVVDTMHNTCVEIFDKKKRHLLRDQEAMPEQTGRGKDIMSVLLKANTELDDNERIPDSELLGHMNTFIFAGHDTSAVAISKAFYQLTLNPDVQDRLRKEVSEARSQHGDLDYDTLMGLPYLDAVVRETLRVHPPASTLIRVAREDTILPLLYPVKSADGKRHIQKGTNVVTSIMNANRNTQIWGDNAEEWKPERWVSPLPNSVERAQLPGVYSSIMTFIAGSHSCIGFKIAEMEMKLVLSVLLESFSFSAGTQEVCWYMNGIYSPGVKNSKDMPPSLPLTVSLLNA